MNVALRLQYDETQRRPAAAWFVVGAAADEWLAELADWQAPLAGARLYVVPTSLRDRTPCGLFVVGAAPRDGRGSPRSLPYAAVDRRLFIPSEARLEPAVADAELAELVGDDVYVWHPQAGLVALPAASARRVSELVAAPPPTTDVWTVAVPGVALNNKLVSLEPDAVPTADDVLNDARGDIGSQPLDLGRMPPAPNEPLPGMLGDAARAMGQGIAKAAQWLAQQASSGGGGSAGGGAGGRGGTGGQAGSTPGWLSALGDWAGRRLEQLSQSLEAARHRELNRLMNLLQDNPDEGLRFALPMGGGEHRGLALPSSSLSANNVNFSLTGLQGGGPADFWDVPAEMQRRLLERYRELAAREIALGRHRRAAYIFASLLGDLRSAASTLQDGGHFREAAALYDERLHQPHLAAECLRKGRCWAEAIAIYERLGRHEVVGDLYAELEQPDDAAAAWRRAVDAHLHADDVLAAAKLLEGKLACTDEAYDHLTAAWPTSKQAYNCLLAAFALTARHARYEQAAALIGAAAEKHRSPDLTAPLVDVLAQQARDYPDITVRDKAADRTRVVVADRLGARIELGEVARLVAAVGKLVPEDRLLARDGHRYVGEQRRRLKLPAATTSTSLHTHAAPTVFHRMQLPGIDWRAAVATDDAIYLAGYRDRELVVMRTDWKGAEPDEPIGVKWEVEPGHVENPVVLAADSTGNESLIVHVIGTPPLPHLRWFKASDRFPTAVSAGPHRGVTVLTYGVCRTGRETVQIVDWGAEAMLIAHAYLARAQLGGVSSIDLLKLTDVHVDIQYPLPMAVRDETLCVAIGQNLCFTDSRAGLRIMELPHAVTQLVASPPHTRARLAVAMQQGGLLLWGNDDRAAKTPFASEMQRPRITLTRDGTLVAVSDDEVELYSTSEGRLRLRGRVPLPAGPAPLAVLSSRHFNRIAILYRDARLVLYDVPTLLASS